MTKNDYYFLFYRVDGVKDANPKFNCGGFGKEEECLRVTWRQERKEKEGTIISQPSRVIQKTTSTMFEVTLLLLRTTSSNKQASHV